MSVEIIKTEIDEMEDMKNEIMPLMTVSKEIVVTDWNSHRNAGEITKSLTKAIKMVEGYFKPIKTKLDEKKKNILDEEKEWLGPLEAEKKLKIAAMRKWEDEQEVIRRAEQAKAEAEARRIAEEAALSQAVAFEQNGHKEAAEAVIAAPVVVPAVFVPKVVSRGYGNFTHRHWGAEVTDLMALVKAVAAGQVPIQAIDANMVFLNGQARMMKAVMAYPGVRAVEK